MESDGCGLDCNSPCSLCRKEIGYRGALVDVYGDLVPAIEMDEVVHTADSSSVPTVIEHTLGSSCLALFRLSHWA